MRQSFLQIIWSMLFGAATALAVAYAVYMLMLVWDRLTALIQTVAAQVNRQAKRRLKPTTAKPAFTLKRTR